MAHIFIPVPVCREKPKKGNECSAVTERKFRYNGAMMDSMLYSFVGNHDPAAMPHPQEDPGPVLSLLRSRGFSHVVLFLTNSSYGERARVIQQVITREQPGITFSFVELSLESVVDYQEIYTGLTAALRRLEEALPGSRERCVLLDPGTPQMQTVWFLLVHSRVLPAVLLQGIPPQFGGGRYRCREILLDSRHFPLEVTLTQQKPPAGHHRRRAATGKPSPQEWTLVSREILGNSAAMEHLRSRMEMVIRYEDAILVTGETGTGKDLVARHLHIHGRRHGRPFITVNCANLNPQMAESVLFGHRRGAFTGADSERPGAFRAAHTGTLFLDEVGEIPLEVQAKLLRSIETGEVTPLGEDQPGLVDVRIIAATNRDLLAMVHDGTFREDLYERLHQFPLTVPPLRERDGDIAVLAAAFVREWSEEHHEPRHLADAAVQHIEAFPWPRNVRQLKNVVRRMCAFAPAEDIDGETVQRELQQEDAGTLPSGTGRFVASGAGDVPEEHADLLADLPVDLPAQLHDLEQRWFAAALHHAGGNRAAAARLLKMEPATFRKALRERHPELEPSGT